MISWRSGTWSWGRAVFYPLAIPSAAGRLRCSGQGWRASSSAQGQALGRWVRIGDRRYRVIGTLGTDGESLGMDMGDLAIIPVASAQSLFDSPALFRILVQAPSRSALPEAKEAVRAIVRGRHEGEDDVTSHHPGRAARHLRQESSTPSPWPWPASPPSA